MSFVYANLVMKNCAAPTSGWSMAMVSDSPHIASQVQAQEHVSASTDTNNTDDRDKVNDNNDDLNSTQGKDNVFSR